MIYGFLVAGALQGFASPAMQGLMSNQVPGNEHGELQGGLASMSSLTAILSPPFMTQIFGYFTGMDAPVYFPGAPFVAAAALTAMALAVFLRATGLVSVTAAGRVLTLARISRPGSGAPPLPDVPPPRRSCVAHW